MRTGTILSRRVVLLPLIVLLAAGTLTLWTTHRAEQRARELEDVVRGWCVAAGRGEDLTDRLPAALGVMTAPLAAAFAAACADSPGGWSVTVTVGDIPDGGDGGATHHALVDGVGRLVLRLLDRDGVVVIIGYRVEGDG